MAQKSSLCLWFLVSVAIILSGCAPEGSDPGSETTPSEIVGPSEKAVIDSVVREKDEMTQLYLPGGTFLMGSSDEGVNYGIELCKQHYSPCNQWFYKREYPQHEVTISPVLIDKNEITNQQFQSCVDSGVCSEPLTCKKGEPTYQDPEKKDHPVVCVSWEEARNYCDWVGGRLPTEAEWEYAFRGEESLIFTWGDDFIGSNLNYCDVNCNQKHADLEYDDGHQRTAVAGSFPEDISWAGLEDLSGNVAEWVNDWSGGFSSESLVDPVGPETGTEKLIKGCSWYSPAAYCRGSSRPSVESETRYDFLGFRCAQNPSPLINGILEPGEWDQAVVEYFEDGTELYLLISDNHLYLGIKAISDEMISANVFISSDEGIKILHTSAALGTAMYQPEGDTWRKTMDFEWCCRSKIDNASARAMREAFYHTENWLGINTYNGTENELEYKISLSGSERYLAVNFLRVDNTDEKFTWPVGISDGPAQPTKGGFPDTLDFLPGNWFDLEVQK